MDNTINANSLHLYDKEGNLRICLNAGDGDGYAAISLFGKSNQIIEISVQPDGSLSIMLDGSNRMTKAIIGITKDNKSGVDLRDNEGKPGALLGANVFASEAEGHVLHLFKDGEPVLRLPSENDTEEGNS